MHKRRRRVTEIYFVLRTKPGEVLTMPPVWFWVLGWFLTTVAVVGNGFVIDLPDHNKTTSSHYN